jgi:hypothetical protein
MVVHWMLLTEVVRTPQLKAVGSGVGAGGVSINSKDSSEGVFAWSDMVNWCWEVVATLLELVDLFSKRVSVAGNS